MKIVDIIKIWEDGYAPNDLQKEIANHRAEMCDGCDKLRFNESSNFFFCAGCGCPIGHKLFTPNNPDGSSLCPLDKWKK
jgi:hypothetical protein